MMMKQNCHVKWNTQWITAWMLAILLAGVLPQAVVFAQSVQPSTWHMELTHHEFKDWDFSPTVGDRIVITNQSDIVHAIYVTYPDGTVITLTEHVQLPGTSVEWVIPDVPGEYLLRCWIHPVIKAVLDVGNNPALD